MSVAAQRHAVAEGLEPKTEPTAKGTPALLENKARHAPESPAIHELEIAAGPKVIVALPDPSGAATVSIVLPARNKAVQPWGLHVSKEAPLRCNACLVDSLHDRSAADNFPLASTFHLTRGPGPHVEVFNGRNCIWPSRIAFFRGYSE